MPLHPEAQRFLDQRAQLGVRPVEELTPEEARAQSLRTALTTPVEEVARTRDLEIPGPGAAIPVRLYDPNAQGILPLVVFFHGGGWVTGSLETADATCRSWANAMGCLVASVNYRHAPEHKFPAAAADAYAATKWLSAHAAEVGGDPARLAVSGSSAGGNLAAVVPLMARERGGPSIAFQLLSVPITDYNLDTPSYRENAVGYGLTRDAMQWYWGHYLSGPQDGSHPFASPLRTADLVGLPPALVLTAEYDPLRDEGRAYADALRVSGVPVEFHCYTGMIHPYLGADALTDAAAAIRRAFHLV